MADESDIETALALLVANVVYPAGIAAPSITGGPVRVYRGWPNSRALDADLAIVDANGQPKTPVSNITVYARKGLTRNLTRYQVTPYLFAAGPCTLLVSVAPATGSGPFSADFAAAFQAAQASGQGQVVVFAGVPAAGQLVGVLSSGIPAGYQVLAADTLASVAAAVSALIPGSLASGPAVLITGAAGDVQAVAVALDRAILRTRQIRGRFAVSCWCADIASRDALCKAVDAAISAIDWLYPLNDVPAQIEWEDTFSTDVSESANLYRRDLFYRVDYETTTLPAFAPRALFVTTTVSPTPLLPPAPAPAAPDAQVRAITTTLNGPGTATTTIIPA